MAEHNDLGNLAEELAATFLEKKAIKFWLKISGIKEARSILLRNLIIKLSL